jgi:hypothetical protein
MVAALLAVAAVVPTTVAWGAGPEGTPIGAWCGGSYGAASTNFGECVSFEAKTRVAGESTGITQQGGRLTTAPEYPATEVTFQNGKAIFNKKELNLNYTATPQPIDQLQVGDE